MTMEKRMLRNTLYILLDTDTLFKILTYEERELIKLSANLRINFENSFKLGLKSLIL